MLHQWFACVHLLDTYLANLTEGFQLSFTTHQFPAEQHKVVCNQHLHAECGGSPPSLQKLRQIHQIQPISDFFLSQDILTVQRYEIIQAHNTGLGDGLLIIRNLFYFLRCKSTFLCFFSQDFDFFYNIGGVCIIAFYRTCK